MNAFLATSYTSEVGDDGRVLPAYRQQIEALMACLEQAGYAVFSAPHAEGWKINDQDPIEAFKMDIEELNKADLVVAYVKLNPPSVGVQFELGMSYAQGKPVVLIHHISDKLPYMNLGLVDSDNVTELVYDDSTEVVGKLEQVLS